MKIVTRFVQTNSFKENRELVRIHLCKREALGSNYVVAPGFFSLYILNVFKQVLQGDADLTNFPYKKLMLCWAALEETSLIRSVLAKL